MRAEVDDELVVRSHKLGEPARHGHVLETRGPNGTPPFVVRWDDAEQTTLVFPGPDASVIPGRPGEGAAGA